MWEQECLELLSEYRERLRRCDMGRQIFPDYISWIHPYRPTAAIALVAHWTHNSQVVGSSPGWQPPSSCLGKATYSCVPLLPRWYWPRGVISLAGKVTTGLMDSNDSLPPGLWLISPVEWLPRNRDQLRAQRTLTNYWATPAFILTYFTGYPICLNVYSTFPSFVLNV